VDVKKKKIYGLIMVLGLVALLADRLFLAEPLPAAATVTGGSVLPAAEPVADAAPLTGRVAAAPFPTDLPGPEAVDSLRDAFALTPAARKVILGEPEGLDPDTGRRVSRRSAAAEFEESHKLSAVMTAPETRVAIVDEQWVQIGQAVDGCRLLEIMGQTALFECADGQAELTVSTLNDSVPPR